MEDIKALCLLYQQENDLQTLSKPPEGLSLDQYVENSIKTMSSTEEVIQKVSVYAKNILNEVEKVKKEVNLSTDIIREQMKEILMKSFLNEVTSNEGVPSPQSTGTWDRAVGDTNIRDTQFRSNSAGRETPTGKGNKKSDVDPNERVMQELEKKRQDILAKIAKTEALASNIGKNSNYSLSEVMDQLRKYREQLKIIEEMIRRIKAEKEKEEKAKRDKEEAERLKKEKEEREKRQKEEAERLQKEKEEKAKKDKEEAERMQKEKEEKAKKDKEEAERLLKEKLEKEKQEEAERLRKEEEERPKREKVEAERLQKEKEEKAKREKEENERIRKEKEEKAKREKAEADRLQKEKEERAKREKEEADRLQKEKEEKAKREKEENERIRKEKEEKAKREKAEADRLQKEKEERAQKEKEEKAQKEKEEAERMRKEREEKAKQAKEKAARMRKEKEEKAKREKEEAERVQKEKEEKAKREREEAERIRKEKEEKAKREKEEAARVRKENEEKAKREKEEADRLRKEKEEKAKREREEAERLRKETEEKLRREREEEERLRKEKEEEAKREKEEAERLRKEKEEAERRDWRNWPPFVYKNPGSNIFNQDICCVICTMPDGIKEDEFICSASDDGNDLDTCLESNDEQLLSSLITIKSKKGNRKFEMPIRVYVPVVKHDIALVSTLKFTIKGKKWRTGKTLREERISKIFSGIPYVGVEITTLTYHFECVQCVAVARHLRDETEVFGVIYQEFEPKVDRNIKLAFPPGAFSEKTIVGITAPHPNNKIRSAAKNYKELRNIQISSSHSIYCENILKKDSEFKMYDFGCVVDKKSQKNQSGVQKALNRKGNWLVNNMNLDDDSLSDVFDSDFVDELKTQVSQGDKNRHILHKLKDTKDSDFEKFLTCLHSKQPAVANSIISDKVQVNLPKRAENDSNEDDCLQDFDEDFEINAGNVVIVSKKTGRSWEIVPAHASKDHPNARLVKLSAGHDKFQFLGLVVPDGMSDEDICRAAEILESLNYVTNVSVICRQKHTNPHDCIIQCVKSEDLPGTLQHLATLGYSDGPADSSGFGVIDGEEIEIKVESNLRFSNTSLKHKFYKNLPFQRYSGNLSVVNKKDQQDDEKYYGNLTYNVPPGRLSYRRNGALILYVPKPLEEIIGNFPYTLDVPVKALAKFISWQLTKDNFNSTRWVKLAGYLTNSDTHIYHQILQHVDKDKIVPPQRERCEIFILYWANHHAQYDTDKIEKIISCHRDKSLEAEARQFIMPYLPGKGILSNDNLEKMAFVIANDWQTMAKKLGFSNEDINNITSNQTVVIKQTLRMLDVWRLSDSAIQKGTDLIKSLRDTAKSLKCGTKLLSIISNYV